MPDKLTLEEAQALLMQKRAQLQKERETAVSHLQPETRDPSPNLTELAANLPPHLGWHSIAFTNHLYGLKDKGEGE